MKTAQTGIPSLTEGMAPELYTITLKNGTILYYTTFDTDLPYRSQSYLAGALNIERGDIVTSVGIEVNDLTATLYTTPGQTLFGLSLKEFTENGGFDGAWVKIERARKTRVTHLFEGQITDATPDEVKVVLTISSGPVLLNIMMPRNTYTPGCRYHVFDTGCTLTKDEWGVASAADTGSTTRHLLCDLSQSSDYFDLGSITCTSGANNGAQRTIREYTVGNVWLSFPLDHPPEAGDTFIAYPGCDRRRTTCVNKFDNEVHFSGVPYMPVPEASI